jgi:hypothetical protein
MYVYVYVNINMYAFIQTYIHRNEGRGGLPAKAQGHTQGHCSQRNRVQIPAKSDRLDRYIHFYHRYMFLNVLCLMVMSYLYILVRYIHLYYRCILNVFMFDRYVWIIYTGQIHILVPPLHFESFMYV